jgi:hypothetical protein
MQLTCSLLTSPSPPICCCASASMLRPVSTRGSGATRTGRAAQAGLRLPVSSLLLLTAICLLSCSRASAGRRLNALCASSASISATEMQRRARNQCALSAAYLTVCTSLREMKESPTDSM